MKKIIFGKAGVTVLEGVIALGLLALVAGGAFGVLLSSSRRSTQPDVREEMVWAVEKAHEQLKAYLGGNAPETGTVNWNKMCITGSDLFSAGEHQIKGCLPAVCDPNNSDFKYTVYDDGGITNNVPTEGKEDPDGVDNVYQIAFQITCNGYQL